MIETIIEYGGIIFAVVGIVCLFLEAFAVVKRKSNPKLVLAGMVCLAVSVVGFLVTEVILRDADISYFFTIAWIVLLWTYIILNLISAMLISRKKRKGQLNDDEQSDDDNNSDDQTLAVIVDQQSDNSEDQTVTYLDK